MTASSSPPEKSPQTFFSPVNPDLLRPGEALDFPLYLHSPAAGRVRLSDRGTILDETLRQKLVKIRAKLFIMAEDKSLYRRYLEKSLTRLIASDQVDEALAATLAYDLSLMVMEAAYDEPNSATIDQAQAVMTATADLILARDQVLFALIEITRSSPQLHVHASNVAVLGLGLAKNLVAEGEKISLPALAPALYFHDLGQAVVSRTITDKPGPLSPEEWERIKEHPAVGRQILAEAGYLSPEIEVVLQQHHERLNGSGYPLGLKGSQIHLLARLCAVADVYDALTSERSYHQRRDGLAAAKLMVDQMAGQFDQHLLRRFLEMFRRAA